MQTTDTGLIVPDRIVDPDRPQVIFPTPTTVAEHAVAGDDHYVPVSVLSLPGTPGFIETCERIATEEYGEYLVLNEVAS
jgi:hypothetical protein